MSNYSNRCVYLTCKSMQVFGDDFEQDPEFQAGMVEFTCTRTFKDAGPDGGLVSIDACSNNERSCFRDFIDLSTGPTPIDEPEPGNETPDAEPQTKKQP